MSSYSSLVEPESVTAELRARDVVALDTSRIRARISIQAASQWSLSRGKRVFDVLVSVAVLVVFCVPMLLIGILIRLTSKGPALFVQRRVGRHGRLFSIYKFRSMEITRHRRGAGLTKAGDARITTVGRCLRKLKLDELPQFYNILRGDMSLVGPRPKLPEYAERGNLAYRPGITGAATLAFRHEEDILACVNPHDVESFYQSYIKPLKASMDEDYMMRATFLSDVKTVLSTLFASMAPRHYPALQHHHVVKYSATIPMSVEEAVGTRNA